MLPADSMPGLSMGQPNTPPRNRHIVLHPKVKQFRAVEYHESAFSKTLSGRYYPHLERSMRPGAYDAYLLPSVVNGKIEPRKMFKEEQ